jgi:hypothetical protein
MGSFKLNNSMMTELKNLKNISGGSQNDALPIYIQSWATEAMKRCDEALNSSFPNLPSLP